MNDFWKANYKKDHFLEINYDFGDLEDLLDG